MLQIKDLVLLDIGIPGDSFFFFILYRNRKKKFFQKETPSCTSSEELNENCGWLLTN